MGNKRISLTQEEIELIEKHRDSALSTSRPRLNPDEQEIIKAYRRIEREADAMNIDPTNVRGGWIKTKDASLRFTNPLYSEGGVSNVDMLEMVKKAVSELELPKWEREHVKAGNKKALRGIISDCHVGMDSNSDGAMFGFEYNEKVFKKHLNEFFLSLSKEIDHHGVFDTIFIDDMGDGLDGYDAETTRGGHKLAQNMNNKQAWDVYVKNKLQTAIDIIELNGAENYVFRSVANDNHIGDVGYMANQAIKMVLERMYPEVTYHLIEKPVEHFVYGKHTFILTHGKDKALMTRNWPLHLNDKITNLIRQYIDHYAINTPYIHVDKGDLHRVGYDKDPKFDYRNYMSFAPPSSWIQNNFTSGYCGYSIQIIPKFSNEIQHSDIFFELKKV